MFYNVRALTILGYNYPYLTLTDRAAIRTLIDWETIVDRDPNFFLVVYVYF